jgi:FKBP-type peptidyl-prolyl cis-trans isomerase SlyD
MTDEQDVEAVDEDEDDVEAEKTETEGESEAGETDEEAEGGIERGDFVRLAYTARAVESEQLVDTTDEEVAEKEGVADQGSFEPRVIVVGEGHLFDAVDRELVGAEVGDTDSLVVPAAEAFGEGDPEKVRMVSVEKIPEDDRYPGASVNIDGQQGYIETVIGGRARVDFNHPLAGQDVEYEYEILDLVEDPVERARGMLSMYIDATPEVWIETDEEQEEVTVAPDEVEDEDGDEDDEGEEQTKTEPEPVVETRTVEKETLYIEATPQMTMNQQWLFSKQQIAQQLMSRLDLERVIVQETIDGGGMGGMGGMLGGMGAGAGAGGEDIEEALEDADVDAEELVDELE